MQSAWCSCHWVATSAPFCFQLASARRDVPMCRLFMGPPHLPSPESMYFQESSFFRSICRLAAILSRTGWSLITAVPLEKLAHRSSDGDCTAQSSPYRCEGPSEEGDAQREPAAGADGDWQVARANVTTCAHCSPSVGILLRTACGDTGVSCRPMITCTAKWLGETRKVLRK